MATNYSNQYLRGLNESPIDFPYDTNDYNHETDRLDNYIKQGTIISITNKDYSEDRRYNVVSINRFEEGISDRLNDHYYPVHYQCSLCDINDNPYTIPKNYSLYYTGSFVYVNGEIVHLFKNNEGLLKIHGMSEFKDANKQLEMF